MAETNPNGDNAIGGGGGGDEQPNQTKLSKKMILIVTGVVLAIIIGILFLVLKLIVFKNHHSSDTPTIPKFRIDSLSVCSLNIDDSSTFTAKWDLDFSVQNPTNQTVFYQTLLVSMQYQQQPLSNATVTSFRASGVAWKPVLARLSAASVTVADQKLGEAMAAERAGGSVSFNVWLYAGYWLNDDDPAKRVWSAVEVLCSDAKVAFSSDEEEGKLLGGPIDCIIITKW